MLSIPITDNSSVGEARRSIVKYAKLLDFPEIEIANLSIIVVEAASNLIKHTPKGGEIVLAYCKIEEAYGIMNIYALDTGHGMLNVSQCMVDGYSSLGTQGTGLGAIKRLSSNFDIYSAPGHGMVAWAQIIFQIKAHFFCKFSYLVS